MKTPHFAAFSLALLAGCAAASPPRGEGARATAVGRGCPSTGPEQIGSVWTGVGTAIGAARTSDCKLLVAYYAPDRFVTVASLDLRSGQTQHQRMSSQFRGWDAHNDLAMAIGSDGIVHIVGNMHASPMFYASGRASDISSIRQGPMTGQNEQSSTYPRFLHDSDGNLLFLYRDGHSGDGTWLLNEWRGGHWTRVGPLFIDHDSSGPVSAYPSNFVRAPDGSFHVAVVWRRTVDVATNFAVTYARTRDFKTWEAGAGKIVHGPLGPQTMGMVDEPGVSHGLVNNVDLKISPNGQPVILYTKYGADGHNAIFASRPGGNGWLTKQIASSPRHVDIVGGGSLADLPRAMFVDGPGGSVQTRITFGSAAPTSTLALDPSTLATAAGKGPLQKPVSKPIPTGDAQGLADVANRSQPIFATGFDGPTVGRLIWHAQKPNQDKARLCTPAAPRACSPPPSALMFSPS